MFITCILFFLHYTDVAEPERNTPTKEHDIGTSVDKGILGSNHEREFLKKTFWT